VLLGCFAIANGLPTPDQLGCDPAVANKPLVAVVQNQVDHQKPSYIA
jgi:hypothetical protein